MGPTSSVLLDRKIDVEEIRQVDAFIKSVAKGEIKSTKSTRDFWIDPKKLFTSYEIGSEGQFSIHFDNELSEMDKDEVVEIEKLTAQKIHSQIAISAGCNQKGDHNVLGELTLQIAQLLNGLIDFGGDLNSYKKGVVEELRGKAYSIGYNHGKYAYHIADSEFLSHWIKHPNFGMIK